MSYQQIQGQGRQSADSRDSYRSSFRPSIETRDSCTTFGTQVVIDKICVKMNDLDRSNAQIKQQLFGLSKISKDIKVDLEKFKEEIVQKKIINSKQKQQRRTKADKREERHRAMRQGVNDMMLEQMKLIDTVTINIKSIQTDTEKIKFEHMLEKKVQNVEYLGKMNIQIERDFLQQFKQQVKIFKKIGISSDVEGEKKDPSYELQSLLNESSSDDETPKGDGDDEDSDSDDTEDTDFDAAAMLIDLDIEGGGQAGSNNQLLMQEELKESEQSSEMQSFQQSMQNRTQQIGNVTSSISRIQNMFQSLNDIVLQQGQTLDRLEDNILDSKGNTKDTVNELKETLKGESPNLAERVQQPYKNDLSTTCVLIWFVFALVMFLIDFHSEEQAQIEDRILMEGAKHHLN